MRAAAGTAQDAQGAGAPQDAQDTHDFRDPQGTVRERKPVPYRPSLLVPVVTALVCAALAAATGARPEAAVRVLLAPVAVVLALIDWNVHRLPDHLTVPLAGAASVLLGGAALLPESAGSWPSALLGGLALGAAYIVLFLINPNGIGFGDVKLALPLGVALGWYGRGALFVGALTGFLLGRRTGSGSSCCARPGASRRSRSDRSRSRGADRAAGGPCDVAVLCPVACTHAEGPRTGWRRA
ncbi:Type IV leader peptidase family protein [Streptomyces wuyuanensis]|uniref:Type IV leader peptidase family protein n=1 Tax=Streptomyces wuyuanensis TaxID=1196353 RepID=A0A1G9P073_9ACTN|nr:Type IV leader peptidase family protein [Streptomyces wuyuanensis]